MYRVYLRYSNQTVSDLLNTEDPDAALREFTRQVNMAEYDGLKFGVALTRNGKNVAFHRFDAARGTDKDWRGRTDKINLTTPPGRPKTGNSRRNITIDPKLWDAAIKIGGGNASAGIAIAIKSLTTNRGC